MSNRTPIPGDSALPSESAAVDEPPCIQRVLEVFAFSSGLAAAIAAALTLVVASVLEAPESGLQALLAASGTFIVYNLDRLRDIEADRLTAPLRTAFVERNRNRLHLAVGLVGLVLGIGLVAAPRPVVVLLGVIGAVGLLHRRLKGFSRLKATYVSLAWVAACVGMPWLTSSRDLGTGTWVTAILFPTLVANLVASNLGDDVEPHAARDRGSALPALRIARGSSVVAIVLALVAPVELRALGWIPLAEGLALAAFRPDERYRHLVVDGAILLGALASGIRLG